MVEATQKKEITEDQLLEMLQNVVTNRPLYCPYFGYRDRESDYDKCYNCHRKNPLKERGMI